MPKLIPMSDPHLDDVLRRSLAARLEAIDRLWESIGDPGDALPLTDADRADLDRRVAEDDAEPPGGPTWTEFRKKLEGHAD